MIYLLNAIETLHLLHIRFVLVYFLIYKTKNERRPVEITTRNLFSLSRSEENCQTIILKQISADWTNNKTKRKHGLGRFLYSASVRPVISV